MCRVWLLEVPHIGAEVIMVRIVFRHAPRVERMLGEASQAGARMEPDRMPTLRSGRPIHRWGLVLGLTLSAAVAVGCDETTTSSTPPTDAISTTASIPATTTSTEPATTAAPTTTTTTPSTEDQITAAWAEFWGAWAKVRSSDPLDPTPLEQLAASNVVAGAMTIFERQRSSGSGPIDTELALHPTVVSLEDGEAVIEDCVLLVPSFTQATGVWYEARITDDGSGWKVTDLDITTIEGCVPEVMAEAAIDAYNGYYDAREIFWDPPDPDHPLIAQFLADPQRAFIVDLLGEYREVNAALRGRPITHPEVIEVRGLSELVVLSCLEPDIEYGLFDIETGERLPDEPAVREGQLDLESAVMVFEEGDWKVSDLQGQVDFECDFAPTERGLPTV